MAECKGCGLAIEWQERDGKYIPIEAESGQVHKCPAYKKHRTNPQETHTGILTAADDSGATVYYKGKERRYAFGEGRVVYLSAVQNSGYTIPVTVEIAHDAKGFVTHLKVLGPVKPDDLDKVEETRQDQKQKVSEPETNTDFETAEKLKKDLEDARARPTVPLDTTTAGEDTDCMSPSHPLPDGNTLKIGGTINLEHYENLRVEVTGPTSCRAELIEYLDETLALFGRSNPATADMIDSYRRRVLGVSP